jgi:peroxiredoxin
MTSVNERQESEMGSNAQPGKVSERTKNIIIGFVLLNLIGFGVVLFLQRTQRAPERVGGQAPAFTLPVVGGQDIVSLQQHRGKVVMLDFWATWCPPCLDQMPAVQALADDESLADTAVILSVNADEQSSQRERNVQRFLKKHDFDFTTLIDDGSVSAQYGVTRLPTLVVISPEGELAFVETGVHSEADLRTMIEDARTPSPESADQ